MKRVHRRPWLGRFANLHNHDWTGFYHAWYWKYRCSAIQPFFCKCFIRLSHLPYLQLIIAILRRGTVLRYNSIWEHLKCQIFYIFANYDLTCIPVGNMKSQSFFWGAHDDWIWYIEFRPSIRGFHWRVKRPFFMKNGLKIGGNYGINAQKYTVGLLWPRTIKCNWFGAIGPLEIKLYHKSSFFPFLRILTFVLEFMLRLKVNVLLMDSCSWP